MSTGEFVTFGILVVLVIVIAFVGRRVQTVHLPPGAGASGDKQDRRSGKESTGAGDVLEPADAREGKTARGRGRGT